MKRINLLPADQRIKASRERGLIYAILIIVVVVAVLGAIYYQRTTVVSSKQEELASVQAQITSVQSQIAALAPYARIQATYQGMSTTAAAIYQARVPWSTILEEISLVIPANVRLTALTCAVPPAMQPGGAGAAPGVVAPQTVDVTFAGETETHQDVADFMTRLGLMPQLTNVQLTTSSQGAVTAGATPIVTFTVTASLRPYLTPPPPTALSASTP